MLEARDTILHHYLKSEQLDAPHLLINCGCEIETLGSSGTTALHKAAKKNHANAVIILLDRGIDPKHLRSERIHSSISFATMS